MRSPKPEPSALIVPFGTWTRLIWSWVVVVIFLVFGPTLLALPFTALLALICFAVLFGTIINASFGVVKEADHLAHQLGEPYGTLILTLSIVAIEVVLIVSVLLGPTDNPTIGRDSIFAVMMIILNLVMGLCLLVGGSRYGEQEFNAQGTTAYISMITMLTVVALVLPNYLSGQGELNGGQAVAISTLTALLYGVFLLLQMRGYRRFFVQPKTGAMTISPVIASKGTGECREGGRANNRATNSATSLVTHRVTKKNRELWIRSAILLAMIFPIVLLAHDLAIVVDYGIVAIGAPIAIGGVLIAIIVFTPESITAVKAAMNNEMQRAINLCLGAFVSTVGLTVPAVLLIGLMSGKQVLMGISSLETVLLTATIAVTFLSFNGQRTSPIQGLMHIGLFFLFGYLLFAP